MWGLITTTDRGFVSTNDRWTADEPVSLVFREESVFLCIRKGLFNEKEVCGNIFNGPEGTVHYLTGSNEFIFSVIVTPTSLSRGLVSEGLFGCQKHRLVPVALLL